jgi:DNA-binding MarR family transcriptional regulator
MSGISTLPLAVDDSTTRSMDALRRIVRALSTSARQRAGNGALSGTQLFVLRQIATAPAVSINELANRTLARQAAVSEVVARLIEAKLVARTADTSDARQAVLSLTAKGRRAIMGVDRTAQEQLLDGLAALTPAMRASLASSLEAWLVAAGLAAVPATMFFEGDRG